MDILTPHDGITNAKSDKAQIEHVERKQREYRLIGQTVKVPGHALFKFDTVTRIASRADVRTEITHQYDTAIGGIITTKKSSITHERNCYYEQALNMKNFIKRLRRRGIIGSEEIITIGS
ncbi:MAG: hypothetical protein V8Q54_05655 [Alistipes senegalensis]